MKKLLFLFLVLILISCGKNNDNSAKIEILVTILPQQEFVRSVGEELVEVHTIIPPGSSPATYAPKPQDLQKIENAKVYFLIGELPFEKAHIEKIKQLNPDLRIVNTSKNVQKRYFGKSEEHKHHEHEQNNIHEKNIDPHTWLSPKNVQKQIAVIQTELSEIDPQNSAIYKKNATEYLAKLDSLDRFLQDKLSKLKNRDLMVFHPAWGYFARDYKLQQIAIEHDGKEPTSRQIQQIINMAKKKQIGVIFVQAQFDRRIARSLAENIGGTVVSIDPLAPDYISNLTKIGQIISENLNE